MQFRRVRGTWQGLRRVGGWPINQERVRCGNGQDSRGRQSEADVRGTRGCVNQGKLQTAMVIG